jgi:hypothetical protein
MSRMARMGFSKVKSRIGHRPSISRSTSSALPTFNSVLVSLMFGVADDDVQSSIALRIRVRFVASIDDRPAACGS